MRRKVTNPNPRDFLDFGSFNIRDHVLVIVIVFQFWLTNYYHWLSHVLHLTLPQRSSSLLFMLKKSLLNVLRGLLAPQFTMNVEKAWYNRIQNFQLHYVDWYVNQVYIYRNIAKSCLKFALADIVAILCQKNTMNRLCID